MFSQTMSFRNGCCRDSSAVILFEGSSVSIRSNRSSASAGILKENKQNLNFMKAILHGKKYVVMDNFFICKMNVSDMWYNLKRSIPTSDTSPVLVSSEKIR